MSVLQEFYSSKLKEINPESWDKLIRTIDNQLKQLQVKQTAQEKVASDILKRGLQVIEDGIGPSIIEAQEKTALISALMRSLGVAFTATSATEVSLGLGPLTFVIDESARDIFAPVATLSIRKSDDAAVNILASLTSYDRTNGVLVVDVTSFEGMGDHANWVVSPTAAPNLSHETREDNPHSVTAAQVGTKTSAEIDQAIADAVDALVGGAPDALDTLNELADALGDEENYAASIAAQLSSMNDGLERSIKKNDNPIIFKASGVEVTDYSRSFSAGAEAIANIGPAITTTPSPDAEKLLCFIQVSWSIQQTGTDDDARGLLVVRFENSSGSFETVQGPYAFLGYRDSSDGRPYNSCTLMAEVDASEVNASGDWNISLAFDPSDDSTSGYDATFTLHNTHYILQEVLND